MDSLKVSLGSVGSGALLFMDLLPYVLGIIIGIMNIIYLYYKIKKNKGIIMDIKTMLVKLAEEQAEIVQEQAIGHIASDDFSDRMAEMLNDKINIPFVKEEKEGKMFKELVEVIQDLVIGLMKGK